MENPSDTIDTTSSGFERLKWGCLWVVLNPLWIILLGVAAYLGWNSWQQSADAESVTGTVVSMRQVSATRPGGVSTYAPTISYTVNGRSYTYRSSSSSFPPAYKVGDTVTLEYAPGDPNDVRVDSWWAQWLLPALLGGAGLVVA